MGQKPLKRVFIWYSYTHLYSCETFPLTFLNGGQDKKSGQEEVLWEVNPEVRAQRLKRYTVPIDDQTEWESAKLWLQVSSYKLFK